MKLKYLLTAFIFVAVNTYSQSNKQVLFFIDEEPTTTQEFMDVYTKNLSLIPSSPDNTIESSLKLYVDYKLKVKEAKTLGLDTVQKFIKELKQYKNSLMLPYLKDEVVTKKLVAEAYNRLQKEVNASHILIFLKPNASETDTLAAYNTLLKARNLIIEGQEFSEIAKQYSQDPSVQQNGGEIGYFSALQMVYPFENAAYSTAINEVSMPFRTKFGYHILKINNIRKARGEVEVAHIMLKAHKPTTKQRIDSIYTVLQSDNVDFFELAKKVSEDKSSAFKGGKLPKFGAGKMIDSFADVAFDLTKEGEISKPFETSFGWHIVKLIKKYPVESFEDMEVGLTQHVASDERSHLIGESVIKKLQATYNIVVNASAFEQFKIDDWKVNSDKFDKELLVIEGQSVNQLKFVNYLKKVGGNDLDNAFQNFKEQELLTFYKENLEDLNPEFATSFKEFKEGLMLFDLLETKVWNKSKDSIGIANFYTTFKESTYKNKELSEIKGTVISDYQNYLEQQWIDGLYKKYHVSFNKSEKKKILRTKT